uniref:Uncharacterized protein n=1 Tax=Strongyloides papillosus TaxID=174720 RepID=A0A0N5BB10_STREA
MLSNFIVWKNFSILYCKEDDILPDILETFYGKGIQINQLLLLDESLNKTLSEMFGKKNWKFLSIIEHPIERFFRKFIHYCVNGNNSKETQNCYGCKDNLECLLTVIFKVSTEYTKKEPIFKPTYFDEIFMPYSWKCNFYNDLSDYEKIIYYDKVKFKNQITKLLNDTNVIIKNNNTFDTLIEKAHEKNTENGIKKYQEMLLNDRRMLFKFVTVYFHDFLRYGIEMPTF